MWRKIVPRLTITLLAVLLLYGLILGLPAMFWQGMVLKRAFGELVLAAMTAGERARCESNPAEWVFKSPSGGKYFAYDRKGVSQNPSAPKLPERVFNRLNKGESVVLELGLGTSEGDSRTAAVVLPWSGPCSIVAGRLPLKSTAITRTLLLSTLFWALVCALLALGAGVLVYWPMVKRIHRLKRDVAAIAEGRYSTRIELDGKDELADLAQAFNRAAEEITKRDEAMAKLLQDVSHDLVTPLASLQAALESIASSNGKDPAVFQEHVSRALEEVTYMASLVKDLKTASKSDLGMVDPRRVTFDLAETVKKVADRFGPLARLKGISLDYSVPDEPVEVNADPSLVLQAVSNIVQNSVQYNTDQGHVAIVLARDRAGTFRLEVRDDGPGVPRELWNRLTERLFRADEARARRPGGMGLGLSIADQVVRSHGWRMEFFGVEPRGFGVLIVGKAVTTGSS